MDRRHDVAELVRWDIGGGDAEQRCAQVAADPRFADAARALASNFLAIGENDKALDGIFKDAGRYVVAVWAVYLHVSGGLTLPRLKEVCAASGLVSPGRARALLIYLRYLGYVELLPVEGRGETARYRPTARFLNSWRGHLRAALEAACILEPAVAPLLDNLRRDDVFETLACIHGENLLASAHTTRHMDILAAYFRVFLHRHAGSQIVWTLLTADNGAFPPQKPLPFSIAAAAHRFGVSRIHVRRLLDAAEDERLLRFGEDGTVVLEEAAREAIRFLYAGQLAVLLAAATETMAEMRERLSSAIAVP